MRVDGIYVNEIFESIQGEGTLYGYRTLFVRLQGCKIGCVFCDSKNTWKKNRDHKIKVIDLYYKIKELIPPNYWLCFTGGEPLEQITPLVWLLEKLHKRGYKKLSLETAGIPEIDQKDILDLSNLNIFFSVSPKLFSALKDRFNYHSLLNTCKLWDSSINVSYKLQFKFVVGCSEDLEIIKRLYNEFKTEHHVFLQIEHSKVSDINFVKDCMELQKLNGFAKVRIGSQQNKFLGLQ